MTLLLLGSCSNRFVYNNMDWLIHWYIDDYIEFTGTQRQHFDQRMDAWLVWHRSEELAKYRQQLLRLKILADSPEAPAHLWLAHLQEGRSHWLRVTERLAPDLARLALSLSESQINALFHKFHEQADKRQRQRAEKGPEARLKDRQKRTLSTISDWAGKLSDRQKAIIRQSTQGFAFNDALWDAYQQRVRDELHRLILAQHAQGKVSPALITLLTNPTSLQGQTLADMRGYNRRHLSEMLERLWPTLSARQRKRIGKQITNLVEDIEILME